jgi:hypothetical protein
MNGCQQGKETYPTTLQAPQLQQKLHGEKVKQQYH